MNYSSREMASERPKRERARIIKWAVSLCIGAAPTAQHVLILKIRRCQTTKPRSFIIITTVKSRLACNRDIKRTMCATQKGGDGTYATGLCKP